MSPRHEPQRTRSRENVQNRRDPRDPFADVLETSSDERICSTAPNLIRPRIQRAPSSTTEKQQGSSKVRREEAHEAKTSPEATRPTAPSKRKFHSKLRIQNPAISKIKPENQNSNLNAQNRFPRQKGCTPGEEDRSLDVKNSSSPC